jgi:hypothetical protein
VNEKKHPFVESDMMEGDMLKMICLLAYERGPTNQPTTNSPGRCCLLLLLTSTEFIFIMTIFFSWNENACGLDDLMIDAFRLFF